MSVDWGTEIDWGWDYKGRHDEGVVRGRFQVPRFQTKVRNVKVLGRNVIVDVTVEHKNLHKGLFHPEKGGQGARDSGRKQLLAPLMQGIVSNHFFQQI